MGPAFRIVTKKFVAHKFHRSSEDEKNAQALLSVHPIRADAVDERTSIEKSLLFTIKELQKTLLSIKDKKGPRPRVETG